MPIAPSKWRKRSERKSTEQRVEAKRRAPARDSRGRFCRTPPQDNFVNQLAGQPFNVGGGGQSYQITNVDTFYGHALRAPAGGINMMPFQQQVAYLNNTIAPSYYIPPIYTGSRIVANSPYVNDIWSNNWNITGSAYNYTSISPTITWSGWINDTALAAGGVFNDVIVHGVRGASLAPLTPEEIEAERIRQDQQRHQQALATAERQRQYAAAREAQDEALQRARATFRSCLSPKEREVLEREGCIYVNSQHGRRYRIRCTGGQSGNVELVDRRGKKQARFCVHPAYDSQAGTLLPDPDAWMTQKLFLEHDEDEFLRVANLLEGRRPNRAQGLALAA